MEAHRYKLLNASECKTISEKLTTVLSTWQHEWFLGDLSLELSVSALDSVENASVWYAETRQTKHWLAFGMTNDMQKRFARAIGGRETSDGLRIPLSPILSQMVEACLIGLASAWFFNASSPVPTNEMQLRRGQLSEKSLRPGLGAARVSLAFDSERLDIVLDPAVVGQFLVAVTAPSPGPSLPLVRRADSMERLPTSAVVSAGSAELTLAELAAISVGDVIRLDRTPEQGLLVTSQSDRPIARAQLGMRDGRRAVKLRST